MDNNLKFNQTIDGWVLTSGPPGIAGYENYGANPGPLIKLADVSFETIPKQTITPEKSTSENLVVTRHTGDGQWNVLNDMPLVFNLTTPYNCDVQLEISLAGSANVGRCKVSVNGSSAGIVDYAATLSTRKIGISSSLMKQNSGTGEGNVNTFCISETDQYGGFSIQSISVYSIPRPLTAHAQWFQLVSGTVPQASGDSIEVLKSTKIGCVSTNSEAQTLSKSLNISGNASPGGILKSLGLGLTVAFSQSDSRTTGSSININTSTTFEYKGIVKSSPKGPTTYQLYQLRLIYSSGTNAVSVNQQTYILNALVTPKP